jgi:hypothetical protein
MKLYGYVSLNEDYLKKAIRWFVELMIKN